MEPSTKPRYTAESVAQLIGESEPKSPRYTADNVIVLETNSMSENYPETVEPHRFLGIKNAPVMPDETTMIDPRTGKTRAPTMDIAGGGPPEELLASNDPITQAGGALQVAGQDLTGVAGAFFNQQTMGLLRPAVHQAGYQFPQAKTEAGKTASDIAGVVGAVTSPLMRFIYGAQGAKASEIGTKLIGQKWGKRALRGAIGGAVYQGEGNLEDAINPKTAAFKAGMGAVGNVLIPPLLTKTGEGIRGLGTFFRKNIAKFEDDTARVIHEYGISNVITKAREASTYILDTVVPQAQKKIVDMFVKGGKGIQTFYQDLKLSPDQIKTISRISKPIREKFTEVLMTGDRNKIVTAVNKARQAVGMEKGALMAQLDTAYMKASKTVGALRKELIGKTLNINGTLDKDLYGRATPAVKKLTDAYLTGMEKTGNKLGMSVYKLPARVMDTMGTWIDAAYKFGESNSAVVAKIAKIHSREMGSQVNKYLKLPQGQRWGDIMDRYSQLSYLAKIGDKFGKLLNPNELEKALMGSVGKDAGRTGLQRSAVRVFGKGIVDDIRKFLATQDVINGKAASIGVTSKSGALQAMGAQVVKGAYHIREDVSAVGKAVGKVVSPLAKAVNEMAEEVGGGLNRFQGKHGQIVEPGTWSKSTQEAVGGAGKIAGTVNARIAAAPRQGGGRVTPKEDGEFRFSQASQIDKEAMVKMPKSVQQEGDKLPSTMLKAHTPEAKVLRESMRKGYPDFDPVHTKPKSFKGRVIVIEGPSGAGKSDIAKEFSGFAIVDKDIMAESHPLYAKYGGRANNATHEELSDMLMPDVVRDYAKQKADVIIPLLGKSKDSVQEKLNLFKKYGYTERHVVKIGKDGKLVTKDVGLRNLRNKQVVNPKVTSSIAGEDIEATYQRARASKLATRVTKYEYEKTGTGYKDYKLELVEDLGAERSRVPFRKVQVFSSSNVSENSPLSKAIKGMTGSQLASDRAVVADHVKKFLGAGKKFDNTPALGTWADGAENSVVTTFHIETKDIPKVDKLIASLAHKDSQREVMGFVARRGGKQALRSVDIPLDKHSLEQIHQAVHSNGIEYSTITKIGNNARVIILDKNKSLLENTNQFLKSLGRKTKHNVEFGERRGIGGWQNKRIETKRIARKVLEQ